MARVKEAIRKRDEFLEKHPHLKDYQEEIEKTLNKCNPKDRLEALKIMIGCKLNEFSEQLYKISDINKLFMKGPKGDI